MLTPTVMGHLRYVHCDSIAGEAQIPAEPGKVCKGFSTGKCASSESWHDQWEQVPPEQKSKPRSLNSRKEGN